MSEKSHAYYLANRDRIRARNIAWRAAHPEKRALYRKRYRKAHPEQEAARKKRYRKLHPEKARACARRHAEKYPEYAAQWQKKNPEKMRAYAKKWYAKNAEKIRARYRDLPPEKKAKIAAAMRAYREADPERYRYLNRRWKSENREKQRAAKKKWWAKKGKHDPRIKFEKGIRKAMKAALRRGRCGDALGKFVTRFGYTGAQLRAHLERQFTRGMSWGNYGEWHVDHILPLASFNLSSAGDADFKAAWALTNLRPMWAKANISKGSKRLTLL